MIDSTECAFFLSADASITSEQAVDRTISPWIFYQLFVMNAIRTRLPDDHRRRLEIEKAEGQRRTAQALVMQYTVHSRFPGCNSDHLLYWRDKASERRDENALNVLYELTRQAEA